MTYLELKKQHLLGYLTITKEIELKLQEEDYQGLQECLTQREQLISKINELDQRVSLEVFKEAKLELAPLLQEIIQFNVYIQDQLKERKEILHREIKRMNSLKKANQLYQNKGISADGLFFDQTLRLK